MRTTKIVLSISLIIFSLISYSQGIYSKDSLEKYNSAEIDHLLNNSIKLTKTGSNIFWTGWASAGIGSMLTLYGYFDGNNFTKTSGIIMFFTGGICVYGGATIWGIGKFRSNRISNISKELSINDFEIKIKPQTNYVLNKQISTLAICITL